MEAGRINVRSSRPAENQETKEIDMLMHITLSTSTPGVFYRDRGSSTAVMDRLLRTCPQGGTVIQAATAARSASIRAGRGALRALRRAARLLSEAGDKDTAATATQLEDEIKSNGLLSCHLPALMDILTRAAATMERAA